MRHVSNGFKNTMDARRDFYSSAVFTFPDGDNLTLGKSEFSISGNEIVDGAGSNAFPLGAVIAKQVTFSINNDRGQYADYSFYDALEWEKTNDKKFYGLRIEIRRGDLEMTEYTSF